MMTILGLILGLIAFVLIWPWIIFLLEKHGNPVFAYFDWVYDKVFKEDNSE